MRWYVVESQDQNLDAGLFRTDLTDGQQSLWQRYALDKREEVEKREEEDQGSVCLESLSKLTSEWKNAWMVSWTADNRLCAWDSQSRLLTPGIHLRLIGVTTNSKPTRKDTVFWPLAIVVTWCLWPSLSRSTLSFVFLVFYTIVVLKSCRLYCLALTHNVCVPISWSEITADASFYHCAAQKVLPASSKKILFNV